MANGTDEGVVSYAVYEDEKQFLGIADINLPDVENAVFTVNGAGMLGEVEIPVTASPKPMTVTINFRHTNEAAYILAEERAHNLTIYRVDQNYDYTAGEIDVTTRKTFMRVFPKKLSGGNLKNATPLNVSGEYAVHYLADYVDGKPMREIDPFNCRNVGHDGVDRAEKIRKGLGMA